MKTAYYSRRDFLQFMGRTTLAAAALPQLLACSSKPTVAALAATPPSQFFFKPLAATSVDNLVLAEGFTFSRLISWQDPISRKRNFGYNNDFTAFIPLAPGKSDEGIMMVNHESVEPILMGHWDTGQPHTKKHVELEMKEVGVSLIHIKNKDGKWELVKSSKYNRRIDGTTPIPFVNGQAVAGKKRAIGTIANCAGGITPWRTFLTCEENYNNYYGENYHNEAGKITWKPGPVDLNWHEYFKYPTEHYGWVVEIHPLTGKATKLTGLGRFSHESATVITTKDGRPVVYSGDDQNNECLYKFIGSKPGSLAQGELFVASLEQGRWLSLDIEKHEGLKSRFKNQLDALVRTREAARIVGATLLDRPEDVEIDPVSGAVFVSLTNNKTKKNYHGSILKIVEDNQDYASLTFTHQTFLAGGKSGFSCPDNLAFDKKGNLWMCTDISDTSLNREPYTEFGNNGLFFIPMSGPQAGKALRVASAPAGAELTGPSFSPDGRTLFLSVQHPGEGTIKAAEPFSHWPDGGDSRPRPTVVMITGPSLDAIVG